MITYEDKEDETIKLILHHKNGITQTWNFPKIIIDLTKIEKHNIKKCDFCIKAVKRLPARLR